MIGLVVVAHGDLGGALVKSAEMILGPQGRVYCVSISSLSVQIEDLRDDLLVMIDKAEDGQGVLLLTDLFGGTPSNLAISTLGIRNVEVIAGVNLPMILKALTLREQSQDLSLQEVCRLSEEAGKKQISVVSELIDSQNS